MLTRSGAEIVVDGDVVHKLHRMGTDPRALAARLRLAATVDAMLSPLRLFPERAGTRWRTSWPLVTTVVAQPASLPWAQGATLLTALHTAPVPARVPVHGWPRRLRRAVQNLRVQRTAASATVWDAARCLPDAVWRAGSPDRPATLVHGDWHLGQLGRCGSQSWQLIDVDDLGVGDPAWDLARPAGFWAAGLIPDEHWGAFLDAYRPLGPALSDGDPWPVLEPFARAAVVHAAASGIAQGDDDATQRALVAACARMR